MRIVMVFVVIALLSSIGAPVNSQAEKRHERTVVLEAAGLRGAISGPNKGESYHAYEFFATSPLPWQWEWPQGWDLSSHIEMSIGRLSAAGKTGWIVAAAPGITWHPQSWRRLSLLANIGVAWVSEYNFGEQAIGGPIQFILSPGLRYRLGPKWYLSYRYRHTSNSALYRPNPGLELHFLELSYRF